MRREGAGSRAGAGNGRADRRRAAAGHSLHNGTTCKVLGNSGDSKNIIQKIQKNTKHSAKGEGAGCKERPKNSGGLQWQGAGGCGRPTRASCRRAAGQLPLAVLCPDRARLCWLRFVFTSPSSFQVLFKNTTTSCKKNKMN